MLVSVIMPVYNAELYICEALDSIINQTLGDFELICVDDGSDDRSKEIISEYMERDSRIKMLHQDHLSAGAARNLGMLHATGKYLYFFDADDKCDPTLLEDTVSIAEETSADIVAFNFYRFYEDGTEIRANFGIRNYLLPKDVTVFNYKDCPDRIMSIINPTPWNKIFRAEFVRKHGLKYEEITSSNDITFCAVCSAYAERIAFSTNAYLHYRVGHANTITSDKHKKLPNVIRAVSSAMEQVEKLPYYQEIEKSIRYFSIDNYIFALKHNVKDFNDSICRHYYEYIHQYFNSDFCKDVSKEEVNLQDLYESYCIVKRHDYETMQMLKSRKRIVSITSYPARISAVPVVLESIFSQTLLADKIMLWLAESQFPRKNADLPCELVQMEMDGRILIKWCDDLKPHKKYFYTMQEYPDDLVITIDDDIIYPENTLEKLYHSYLMYPDAVSTIRGHLMIIDEEGKLLPYNMWIRESDRGGYTQPSMQLFATGAGGVLYPPHLLNVALFNKQAIKDTCLLADDLWLKAMEVVNDVPVVVASEYMQLRYIPGTQETALYHTNMSDENNLNDIQLTNIINWMDENFEKDIFVNRIIESRNGVQIIGIAALCQYFVAERTDFRRKYRASERNRVRTNERLQKAFEDKSKINERLQKAFEDKSRINERLQLTYQEKSEINRKLQITYQEKAERGIRIKQLEKQLDDMKDRQIRIEQLENQLNDIQHSLSFRIGQAITWPFRRLGRLLKY
ncbi:MAG: glycosyltransferase [Clostridiales bacterium]|nr:glycosyltransferase [Clostridiales bacterium]